MTDAPMNPKEGEEPDRLLRHNPSPKTLEESRKEYYKWHGRPEENQPGNSGK